MRYDVDTEVWQAWLKGKYETIQSMSVEEIEARVAEIIKIEFFATEEWRLLQNRFDELTGRKMIPSWLKQERDKMITDPNYKVSHPEPRPKKEKKPKQDLAMEFFGVDVKQAMRELKSKPSDSGPKEPAAPRKPKEDLMAILNAPPAPPKPKATAAELQAKADAIKEKIRLAKLGTAKKEE